MPISFLAALAISIAISVASFLLTPRPKGPRPEAARDLEGPTADAGREVPVIFGTLIVQDPNCLWYGEKESRQYQVKA